MTISSVSGGKQKLWTKIIIQSVTNEIKIPGNISIFWVIVSKAHRIHGMRTIHQGQAKSIYLIQLIINILIDIEFIDRK